MFLALVCSNIFAMGWCQSHSVSPPHFCNFVCITKAPLSASRSYVVKFNHGKKESQKKTGLRKLRASSVQATQAFDSVARVRDGDEHAGEVLDGFSVSGDPPEEVGGHELFYDDGYGSSSVRDYLDIAKEMVALLVGFAPSIVGVLLRELPFYSSYLASMV